jgi:biopolymer transport protein ExbD
MRHSLTVLLLLALAAGPASGTEDLPTVTVTVATDGSASLDGKKLAGKDLVKALLFQAERKRDLEHPMQPSEVRLVLRADPKATWKAVRNVFYAARYPDVRMYRFSWTTILAETPGEKLTEVLGAKDRGLAKTKVRLHRLPKVTMEIGKDGKIRLLDRDIGTGEDAFAVLAKGLPAIRKRDETLPTRIIPADDAPFGELARVFDLCRSAGYEMHLESVAIDDDLPVELEKGPAPEGIAKALEAFAKKDYALARVHYEALFVRKKEDLPRVTAILRDQTPNNYKIWQLSKLARFHPRIMAGLAETLIHCGGQDDLLQAATLSALLVQGSPLYGKDWWNSEGLALRTFTDFGEKYKSRHALSNVTKFVKAVRDLGILEHAPNRKEIEALEKRAKAALAKL